MLWKVLLFTLGGIEDVFTEKNKQRLLYNLPLITENPSAIINSMSPSNLPSNPFDIGNDMQSMSQHKKKKSGLIKQARGFENENDISMNRSSSLASTSTSASTSNDNNSNNDRDDSAFNDYIDNENENDAEIENDNKSIDIEIIKDPVPFLIDPELSERDKNENDDDDYGKDSCSSSSSTSTSSSEEGTLEQNESDGSSTKASSLYYSDSIYDRLRSSNFKDSDPENELNLSSFNEHTSRALPWKPKVRLSEIQDFLNQERKKFLGYDGFDNDIITLVGLPTPIHESVRILKEHLYTSLADEQIKADNELNRKLTSCSALPQDFNKPTENSNPVEKLYSSLFNNLPQYLICLLKILLTSVPQTRPKTESLQIMSDLFPEDLTCSHFHTVKLGIDTNRHKEILIKAISAILLLMLKHFKVNHIYQFEFMSQHLLFANCVPLILKFFNLNISNFVLAKHRFISSYSSLILFDKLLNLNNFLATIN
jgi:hypothetical protein